MLLHWMNLENIMVKEAKHERLHIVRFHLYEMFRVGKSIETESRLMVARGQRREKWGATANEYDVSFSGNKNVPKLHSCDACITL